MIFLSILILIVAIALPTLTKNLSPFLIRISSIILLYSGLLSFNTVYIQSIGSGIGIYSGLFHVTFISQLMDAFLLILGSLVLISWPLTKKIDIKSSYPLRLKTISSESFSSATEYSLIVLFSTLGASLLISSSDLVSMYLSIELQSFGVYILTTLYRNSESATSAGLKYFLLGGLSSCLILLGAGLIYSFTGLTSFESIYTLISVSDNNSLIQGLSLGFILILIGLLFKVSAAPFHNWAPDVYDDSPTIVTIWLTIMPKISILILLLEMQTQFISGSGSLLGLDGAINGAGTLNSATNLLDFITSFNSNILSNELIGSDPVFYIKSVIFNNLLIGIGDSTVNVLKNLLLISSLLSLIIGTVVGLAQTKIKRLLAYSTISHIGFILLALAINTEQSIDSFLFYIIQYSVTNLNIFLIIIALGYVINNSVLKSALLDRINSNNYSFLPQLQAARDIGLEKDIKFINELKGQFFSNPLLSLSLSICLFSMAGIPPLMGFFSKQFVLYSAVQSGYYFISFVAILASVISASYYLKIIRVLHTESEEIEVNENLVDSSIASVPSLSVEVLQREKELNSISLEDLNSESLITNYHSFLISSLTLSILLFVLKPSIILNSTQLLSLSLYNF